MLTLYADISDYRPWSGAVNVYDELCARDLLYRFYDALEDFYPCGLSKTELNDLLWFEREFCYSLVGLIYNPETGEIED